MYIAKRKILKSGKIKIYCIRPEQDISEINFQIELRTILAQGLILKDKGSQIALDYLKDQHNSVIIYKGVKYGIEKKQLVFSLNNKTEVEVQK